MKRNPHHHWTLATVIAATAALLLATTPARAKMFDGFDDQFQLGRSAASGVVCEAKRNFDDPLVGAGVRRWDVTCRGWSQKLGSLYLFPSSGTAQAETAWSQALAASADCAASVSAASDERGVARPTACKTKPDGLDYVAFESMGHGRPVAAQGFAAIADVLATGLRFISGQSPEPGRDRRAVGRCRLGGRQPHQHAQSGRGRHAEPG